MWERRLKEKEITKLTMVLILQITVCMNNQFKFSFSSLAI